MGTTITDVPGRSGEPGLHDMHLFADLYDEIKDDPDIAAAAGRMEKERHWRGGPNYFWRRIRVIEEHLGFTLFDRKRGRSEVHPTPAAAGFRERVRRLLQYWDAAFGSQAEAVQQVVIAATNDAATYHIPQSLAIAGYFAGRTTTELRIVEVPPRWVPTEVANGRADFGVGPVRAKHKGCEVIQLMTTRFVLAFHPGHRFARTQFRSEMLAEETLLVLPEDVQAGLTLPSETAPEPGKGRRVELATSAQLRVWVRHRLGVAIVPEKNILPGDESMTAIRSLPLGDAFGTATVCLYLPPSGLAALRSDAAREMAAHIQQVLSGK